MGNNPCQKKAPILGLKGKMGMVNKIKKRSIFSQRANPHPHPHLPTNHPGQPSQQMQLPPHLQPQFAPQRPQSPPETMDNDDIGFECKYCGKEFSSETNLINHEKLHNNVAKVTKARSQSKETTTKGHECKYCQKVFKLAGNLHNHMKFHLGLKLAPSNDPGECRYCGKIFTTNSYLKEHIRLHTGETPYECKHCGMKFSIRQNQRRHVKFCPAVDNPEMSQ